MCKKCIFAPWRICNRKWEELTYEILTLAAVFSRFGGRPKAVGGGGVAGSVVSAPAASGGKDGVPSVAWEGADAGLGAFGLRREVDSGLFGSGWRISLSVISTLR